MTIRRIAYFIDDCGIMRRTTLKNYQESKADFAYKTLTSIKDTTDIVETVFNRFGARIGFMRKIFCGPTLAKPELSHSREEFAPRPS